MLRPLALLTAVAALLAGCATVLETGDGYRRVTLAQLHRNPERWDGQRVEVTGFVVREFESANIFADYRDYCHAGMRGFLRAVGVEWPADGSLPGAHNRSRVVLRGVFENIRYGAQRDENGNDVIVMAGAYAFGPIRDPEIVRTLGAARRSCSAAPVDRAGE